MSLERLGPERIAVPALDDLPFAVALRESTTLLAGVQSAHLLGVAILVGTVVAFDLRVLGVNRAIPVRLLGRHLLPLSVTALLLVVPSGLAMFAAQASALLDSRPFAIKMALLLAGAVLAIIFHTGPYRGVAAWDAGVSAPPAARLCALASIAGWVGVLACATRLAGP